MATFLDVQDELKPSGDFIFTQSHKYKIYNLLARQFPESPEITLPLEMAITHGLPHSSTTDMVHSYLIDFNASVSKFNIIFDNIKGRLDLAIQEK
jgi:hypothetical protein